MASCRKGRLGDLCCSCSNGCARTTVGHVFIAAVHTVMRTGMWPMEKHR
jgi:hypothetical protein